MRSCRPLERPACSHARPRRGRPPFLLGRVDARPDGGGQALAEQGAAVLQGDAFAGGQHRAVRGGSGDLTHLREKGDGLLQAEPFGLVVIFNRQHRHRNPSQRTQRPRGTSTNPSLQNREGHPIIDHRPPEVPGSSRQAGAEVTRGREAGSHRMTHKRTRAARRVRYRVRPLVRLALLLLPSCFHKLGFDGFQVDAYGLKNLGDDPAALSPVALFGVS